MQQTRNEQKVTKRRVPRVQANPSSAKSWLAVRVEAFGLPRRVPEHTVRFDRDGFFGIDPPAFCGHSENPC